MRWQTILTGLAVAGLLAGCSSLPTSAPGSPRVAIGSVSPTGGSSDSPTGSANGAAGAAPSTSPVAGAPGSTQAGCVNEFAGPAVTSAITTAYWASNPAVARAREVTAAGDLYYGVCAGVQYAATHFTLPTGDTSQQDALLLEDDMGARQFFSRPSGGAWRWIGLESMPTADGCGTTTLIPAGLRTLWHQCPGPDQPTPVLGAPWSQHASEGFGQSLPHVVSSGGDPTGLITGIGWMGWGGPTATGSGTSTYVAPGQSTAQGTQETATIVAYDLGTCQGRPAYLKVVWYYPQHGETFTQNPQHAFNACTGS